MSAVVQQKTIWILTLVHIGLLYGQLNLGWQCGSLWIGEDNATASAMALVVFFSVFYSGNCFTRQNAFYATCMGMAGTCVNYAGLVRVHFPNADGKTMWNACRYVLASVYVLYFELGGSASMGGVGLDDVEWEIMFRLKLLDPKEREVVDNHTGPRFMLLQKWALDGMVNLLAKSPAVQGASIAPFQEQVLALRGHCAMIRNTLKQPVPFPYYHTLLLMLLVNLLLLAYVLAGLESIWSVPCYFITAFVLLGFKETAIMLSDPFGNDAVDFDTDLFMSRMMVNVKALLSPQGDYHGEVMEVPSDV
eukprot:CAMPEP_0181201048 /NCGR_PEP_ID=MMETSP1096-20121128/18099_1 /TAXON_ID=156174 ORGANISM="Chrysochromulina ericina, Strain CCMP281" /NCGR_SAMPLE_ID=MMETSP1096 /ASSEMBLY_ACC=CAM_ASM_000453 /LENGTH=304 /DNA_ID=CAMNT_0023291465 /DNA_START=143 /DNA_END=1057 /DNA_ORIENTATION=-